jgi:hypothetical protein
MLKLAKVVKGEGLQNVERELQGKKTYETIFITWQLYLNGSLKTGLIVWIVLSWLILGFSVGIL